MPDPKDRRAPKFKGKHVEVFVQTLEQLAQACSVNNKELPGWVLRYCASDVRYVLVNESVFKGDDWELAKKRLIYLYESQTSHYKPTVHKLRKFYKKQKNHSSVRNRKTLDKYRNRFVQQVGNLVARKELTDNEVNVMFYHGLPKKLRNAILPILREVMRLRGETLSRGQPPQIEEVLKAARDFYSSDDINRLDNDDDDDSDDSMSDDDDSDSGSSSDDDSDDSGSDTDDDLFKDKKKKRRQAKNKKGKKREGSDDSDSDSDTASRGKSSKKKGKGKKKESALDKLTKQMNELTTRMLNQERERQTAGQVPPSPTNVYTNPTAAPGAFTVAGTSSSWSQD
ncbi:hypothetical protein TRAPUB_13516 [Trametes pubescens]|uniref:Uncharacterized protein n=1 Tax=Trametes pubescens TaxID=154538 RepID=A0A1M2VQY6_TRAPU|nr:hypothetical protein TRAPUB_13516 [Trametes pubescens]